MHRHSPIRQRHRRECRAAPNRDNAGLTLCFRAYMRLKRGWPCSANHDSSDEADDAPSAATRSDFGRTWISALPVEVTTHLRVD